MYRIVLLELLALWIAVYTGSYGLWLMKQGRKSAAWVVYGLGVVVLMSPVLARFLTSTFG